MPIAKVGAVSKISFIAVAAAERPEGWKEHRCGMATVSGDRRDLNVILDKLKVHAEFTKKSEEEIRELADELTNFDKVFCQFSHLLEPVVDKVIDEALKDYRAVFTHSQEEEMAHDRAMRDLARVFDIPVQLFLSRLTQPIPYSIAGTIFNFFLEYGALHAGLIVGNIRIEWGQEGVVHAQPEDVIPADDFVGSVDARQGHLARDAVEINRQFSLADRERRIDDKIKLIINTAEEKNKVLSNLVHVITQYNLEKRYDLFTCNCQHFVRDALAALGIRETPRFRGELNNYLQHLKQGRIEVPEHFQNHSTLDAYVDRQLQAEPGSLDQHDMEYLLLHYYRLHLTSMPENATDEWRCDVPSCKYEHLADRVNREALLNIRLPPSRAIERYAPSTPTIEELPNTQNLIGSAVATGSNISDGREQKRVEEQRRERERQREEQRRRNEEQRQQQIAEDEQTAKQVAGRGGGEQQKQIYEQHEERGYRIRVSKKLRRLSKYVQMDNENFDGLVTSLTEFEAFRDTFDCFPATVEETSKSFALAATADQLWVEVQQLPHDTARRKVKERYESVSKLPVKLVLRVKPNDQPAHGSTFDAQLDAALLIWDHIFEWNSNSIVVPERIDLKTLPPSMMTSVLRGSKWSAFVSSKRSNMQSAAKSHPEKIYKKEIDLLFKLTVKKDDVIFSIIKAVVDYNRNKEYHERDCNNHHFIRDVASAMGIKRLPEIGESLGVLLERSRRLCMDTLPRTDFVDHAELDGFICENNDLSRLTIRDVEYLIGKYFQFHLRNWELSHHPDQWTCQERDCQLRHLEQQFEKLSLSSERKCSIM